MNPTMFDKFFKYDRYELKDHTLTLYNTNFRKSLDCVYFMKELDLEYPYLLVYNKDKQNHNIGTVVTINLNTLIWQACFPFDSENIVCYGAFVLKNNKLLSKWDHLKKRKRQFKFIKFGFTLGLGLLISKLTLKKFDEKHEKKTNLTSQSIVNNLYKRLQYGSYAQRYREY